MRAWKSRRGLTTGGCSITESVGKLWVQTMHRCADTHNDMCSLTGLQHMSSEQHVEKVLTRKKCYNDDLRKIHACLGKHNPFNSSNALQKMTTSTVTMQNQLGKIFIWV